MIETRGLTKIYGELYAVKDLDLKLERGDVFGFIGPNGSGKTTTMRMLATLLQPTYGEAYVCGNSIYNKPKEIRRLIGFMPDFFGVYDDMKVMEYLEFFAAAYRINGQERRKKCEEVLELVELTYKSAALVTSLSRGMTQRLGLARTLLHDPQVLLLDEPASGLDPRARIEMRRLLKELRKRGKTIMFSSHILPELADVCNKVGIIERGVMDVNADVEEVLRRARSKLLLHVGVKENAEGAAKLLLQMDGVESVEPKEKYIVVTMKPGVADYSHLPTLLIEAGYKLTRFNEDEIDLERAFMALTKGITA
jgi:ABC-2 type transport system ATP-binding protein